MIILTYLRQLGDTNLCQVIKSLTKSHIQYVELMLQLYDVFLVEFEILISFIDGFFCKLCVSSNYSFLTAPASWQTSRELLLSLSCVTDLSIHINLVEYSIFMIY